MDYYLEVLRKYNDFSGRSSRAEYWYFFLYNIIIGFAIFVFNTVIIGDEKNIIGSLYSLIVVIPALAVAVRRLHDIGRSGWMFLITLVPLIGPFWLLLLLITDSSVGENQYGPNPKGITIKLETNGIRLTESGLMRGGKEDKSTL